jgi:hypothetical protein
MSAPAQQAGNDWHAAWVDALDALELDVHQAELLLAAGRPKDGHEAELSLIGADWSPPAIEAPLPGDLRTRAGQILERQLEVSEGLARAMRTNRRELQLAERIETGAPDRTVPAFFDSKY